MNPTLKTNRPARRAAARLIGLLTVAAFATGATWGCTREGEGSTSERDGGRSVDSADGALGIPARKVPPYRVTNVANPGRIRGTVDVSGVGPGAASACASGGAAAQPSATTIVWLDDIRSGLGVPAERKLDRRLELIAGRCKLEPRLQLALVGSTLNVRNGESVAHQIELFRDGDPQPIYRIPFIFAGQLVPAERPLTVPGYVEARSSQDPSLRSVVVVVDHPYADTVGADGGFAIDSVPPGRYRIMATNGLGMAEGTVEVGGGAESAVALRLARQ